MEGLELTNALSNGTTPNPYSLPFSKIGVRNPNPKLQSLLSQERVKLRTANLADTFTGSIRTKTH